MNPEALTDLANSIREFGVIEPILVKRDGDRYILVAGERRVMAARKAGLESIPAILRDDAPEEMLAVALIENIQRENLNAVDEARAYRRLQDEYGLTHEEVADRVGKSRVAISNSLRLLQLPTAVLDDVSAGVLSAGHARALLAVQDSEARAALWERIKSEQLSVRASEDAARAASSPRKTSGPRPRTEQPRDPQLGHLEDRLRETLGTQIRIAPKRGTRGGRIEVEYYDHDDLDRLVTLLVGPIDAY